jgi:hypothetical protein
MEQRLSPRERRRLVRRFLHGDQEMPPVTALLAARAPAEPAPRSAKRPAARGGPYEYEYAIAGGYTMERTIIVP